MEPIGKFSWKKWIFEDQFHSHTVDGYKMWTSSTSPDFLPKSLMFWRTFVSCCIHTWSISPPQKLFQAMRGGFFNLDVMGLLQEKHMNLCQVACFGRFTWPSWEIFGKQTLELGSVHSPKCPCHVSESSVFAVTYHLEVENLPTSQCSWKW